MRGAKLLPCPMCQYVAMAPNFDEERGEWRVICASIHCSCCVYEDTPELAVKAWNTRKSVWRSLKDDPPEPSYVVVRGVAATTMAATWDIVRGRYVHRAIMFPDASLELSVEYLLRCGFTEYCEVPS